MKLPPTLRWIALALLGLVIAAAVALGASRLASQQIGIASESVSAGDNLAPPVTPATKRHQEKSNESGPPMENEKTEPTPPTEQTESVEEPEAEPTAPTIPESSSGDDESGGGGDGGGQDD